MESSDGTEDDDIEYATLGQRILGQIIDTVFLGVLVMGVAPFPDTIASLYLLLWVLFALFYLLMLEGVRTNQTLGKYAMGMRVARDDGSPARLLDSVVRNTVGLVGRFFGFFGWLVAVIVIHQSPENKRVGDRFAGTVVLKLPTADRSGES